MSDTTTNAGAPAVHDATAITAIIFAFLFAPLGIILGAAHISAARRAGRAASGLAVAGLITGSLITALAVTGVLIGVLPWFLALVPFAGTVAWSIWYLTRAR
jgi:peptidyl-prolyl cis-trans isomerase B (cyclophilin B)